MNDKNELIVVRESNTGLGIFAKAPLRKDKLILKCGISNIFKQPDRYTIQIGKNQHALLEKPGLLMNHSCEPNAYLHYMEDAILFLALRDIQIDEEICFDYETTELEIIGFEVCCCGSIYCRKRLKGFKAHSQLLRAKYPDNVFMPYLLSL